VARIFFPDEGETEKASKYPGEKETMSRGALE
jgi:hypothetical protein